MNEYSIPVALGMSISIHLPWKTLVLVSDKDAPEVAQSIMGARNKVDAHY